MNFRQWYDTSIGANTTHTHAKNQWEMGDAQPVVFSNVNEMVKIL